MADMTPTKVLVGPFKPDELKAKAAACVGKKLGSKDKDDTTSSELVFLKVYNNATLLSKVKWDEDMCARVKAGGAGGGSLTRYLCKTPFKGIVISYLAPGGIRLEMATLACECVEGVPEGGMHEVQVPHVPFMKILSLKRGNDTTMVIHADKIDFHLAHNSDRITQESFERLMLSEPMEGSVTPMDTLQSMFLETLVPRHHIMVSAADMADRLRNMSQARGSDAVLTLTVRKEAKSRQAALVLEASSDDRQHISVERYANVRQQPGDTELVVVDARDSVTAADFFKRKAPKEETTNQAPSKQRIVIGSKGIQIGVASATPAPVTVDEDSGDDFDPNKRDTTEELTSVIKNRVTLLDPVDRMQVLTTVTYRLSLVLMAIESVSSAIGTLHIIMWNRWLIMIGPEMHGSGLVLAAFGAIDDDAE